MRIDDAGLRTGWLAVAAGWAVAAWLLALVGMGGRIDPLADDPTLLQPLPALPAQAAGASAPWPQYDRDRRAAAVHPRPPAAAVLPGRRGRAGGRSPFDFILTSVLITPR